MENCYLKHTEFYTVAVDEVDFLERLKPSAVLQYFQDLATVHATEIGIGFEQMLSRNLIWVLNRVSVRISSYPKIGEKISVTTYPRKPHIAEALRDYYIENEKGETIISGSSKWCVIDANSHAIRRCAPLFDFADTAYKPEPPFENANPNLEDMDFPENSEVMTGIVRLTDLDRNRHMNNARYGDIILNTCKPDFLQKHRIEAFDINFLNELKYGERYKVKSFTCDNRTYFRTEKENASVFKAEVQWRPL